MKVETQYLLCKPLVYLFNFIFLPSILTFKDRIEMSLVIDLERRSAVKLPLPGVTWSTLSHIGFE